MRTLLAASLSAWSVAGAAFGWSGYTVKEDGVTLSVDAIAPVADPSSPSPVCVRVSNDTAGAISGDVAIRNLVDDWRAEGPSSAAFALPAGGATALAFRVASGPFVFDALYPVHAYARLRTPARAEDIHAVRIFEVQRAKTEAAAVAGVAVTPPLNRLAADTCLPLWQLRTQRLGWQWKDQAPRFHAPGWSGTDAESHATAAVSTEDCGGRRDTLSMHPAYAKSPGSVFCDYLVALPPKGPIAFTAAVALKHGGETDRMKSDGILYRVLVADASQPDRFSLLWEEFTDARAWKDIRVGLDAYAGRTVLLRLETHPGPKWNTGFDSAHWAEPTLTAGTPPSIVKGPPGPADTAEAAKAAAAILAGGAVEKGRGWRLGASAAAACVAVAIRPGPRGLLDGIVAFAGPDGVTAFRGFDVAIDDGALAGASRIAFRGCEVRTRRGETRWTHRLELDGESFDLAISVRADGPALRVHAECPRRISSLALGAWENAPARVYYGHGYVLQDPKAFRQSFGGHNLATSHAGFEFGSGPVVLQAVDNPPRSLEVDPAAHRATLVTDHDATITLLPGGNAMDCAIAYRLLDPRKAAGGVDRLAGRFCFDIWGGRYADIASRMEEAFRYGLTDSFLTIHDWQRWGYDYRLPDIWPPQPRLGTTEELARVGELCRARDVPWGLHDNYIDFYPDAEGFSYRLVYFSKDGRPHRAWYNEGRDALSYKWRPDLFMPFVKRNYRLIRDGVHPSHVFVDVFTSQGTGPFWDHEGRYHASTEMRRGWGEMFAWMRDWLGGHAPTTSEAGHDQLIGWLDGADCQWMRLEPRSAEHVVAVAARDWERVPWYDSVHHDRFILHGAGYSVRYQGGLPRETHGINSDDYLASEVLAGHALMTDAGSWGRAAVRKYWLAQELARRLARRNVLVATFVNGDIHRQRVKWDDGTVVWVNRSSNDWAVAGRVLPPYGFLATGGSFTAAVERIGGRIAESSCGTAGLFCNARVLPPEQARRHDIAPRAEDFRDLGGGRFGWTQVWTCREPAPRDVGVFVHFRELDKEGDLGDIRFQGDYRPTPPASQWNGEIRHAREARAPDGLRGSFALVVGLFDREGRLRIRGPEADSDDIRLGTVILEGPAGAPPKIRFEPAPPARPGLELNPKGTTIDFGFAATDGAFRLTPCDGGARLTPLPRQGAFQVALRFPGARSTPVVTTEPMDPKGAVTPVASEYADGVLRFRCDGEAFAYRIAAETK